MKILFDQGTPAPLRHTLADHTIATAYEMGWAKLEIAPAVGYQHFADFAAMLDRGV